jgi:transposase-like protein
MSKRRFTTAQITELLNNPNVARCSVKSITYAKEFKVRAIKQYQELGWSAVMIFKEAGFDPSLIGKEIPGDCLTRWRKRLARSGLAGLNTEARGKSGRGGRPQTKGLMDTDKIKRMAIEIAYLKAENDFLAKLRAAKKR